MITEFEINFKRDGDKAVINGHIQDDKLPEWRFYLKDFSVDVEIIDFSKSDHIRFIKAEIINCVDMMVVAYENDKGD
jgi:hypothetical protein